MGSVFPEVRAKQSKIKESIKREEGAFNKTLDKGIEAFDTVAAITVASSFLTPTTGMVRAFGYDVKFLENVDVSDWVSVTL